MNILIIGSGGREHALAVSLASSSHCKSLYVAPGNAGTEAMATNLTLDVKDHAAVIQCLQDKDIQMLVIGPEDPLVAGLADDVRSNPATSKVLVIGPGAQGATLEGSKQHAKEFMARHGIPTAGYKSITYENLTEGLQFLENLAPPYVLKADGLAAGKGVLILDSLQEAQDELRNMLDGKFGSASATVVIEEFLDGIEFSIFALTDGTDYVLLPAAKDYKRMGEGDTGLNTGGMGAVSPPSFLDDSLLKKVEERIVAPTVRGLAQDKTDYVGFIFFGLIRVGDEPMVIEYNVRMGDPETEVVLPRITSDTVELFKAAAQGKLKDYSIEVTDQTAAGVILVSGGYPEAYEKGKQITGLEHTQDVTVYHAGTRKESGQVLTNGGRVLCVTALDNDLQGALDTAYKAVEKIKFEKATYRRDIGQDLLTGARKE